MKRPSWEKGDILIRIRIDLKKYRTKSVLVEFSHFPPANDKDWFHILPKYQQRGKLASCSIDCYQKLDKPIMRLLK